MKNVKHTKPVCLELTEAEIEGCIVHGLRALGYLVWKTQPRGVWAGSRRHGTGVDKGIPDLLVAREEWGPVRLPLEIKRVGGTLSREQEELVRKGMMYVARSWEDALAALRDFETRFGFKEVARRVS